MNDNLTVTYNLILAAGVITTGTDTVYVSNSSASALSGYSNASFINGHLVRSITTNTSTYGFPLGNGTGSPNYYLAEIDNILLNGPSNIYGKFGALQNHDDEDLAVSDGELGYSSINSAGTWILEPDVQPTLGTYNIRLYTANMSGLEDNKFGIVKRPVGSASGSDWTTGGGFLNALDGLGRLVSDGFMLRLGLSSFSEFGAGEGDSGGGLPIKLISFIAKENGDVVNIDWTTETEVNNDYFTIERSHDGSEFVPIAIIEGAGNSSQRNTYNVTDEDPLDGLSYYRLKQTDFDGAYEYSDVVSVNMTRDSVGIKIYPNPVYDSFFFINFGSIPVEEDVKISLSNLEGKLVYQNIIYPEKNLRINLPDDLKDGYYFLKCSFGNQLFQSRILIN